MKKAMRNRAGVVVSAAGSLTGKRFGLLVASSLVATSAVLAGALTGVGRNDALASLLARQLGAADDAPIVTASSPATPSGEGPSAPQDGSRSPAGPSASQAPAPAPAADRPKSRPTPSATPSPAPEAGRVKHVFVISLTSPGYEAVFGAQSEMPYLATTLRPQGELLSGYTLLDSAALPNGIAAISGQSPNPSTEANCATYAEFPASAKVSPRGLVSGSGCVYPVEVLTLADQLTSARYTWRAYVAGMVDEGGKPKSCMHPESDAADEPAPGGYATRQNPFVYFHSLLDLGDCASNDVALPELEADLHATSATPNYSFIAPTPCEAGNAAGCHEGMPSGPTAADAFLAQWVPKILASPAYKKDGVLIIDFDQLGIAEQGAADPAAPKVGALLLSRFLPAGATDASPYTPYSLLRSVEDLFGLSHLARANGSQIRSFAPSLLGEAGRGD